MTKPDARLREDVINELAWDMRVDSSGVEVLARSGIITLSGVVRSYPQKLAAAEAAHRVAGVLDVANEIEVRLLGGTERTDPEIAAALRNTLEWDVDVPHEKIQSTVTDGVVVLDGEVANTMQRDAAMRAVRNLIGVKTVIDSIHVRGVIEQTKLVEQSIRAAFARHAHRDAEHIRVDVDKDTATLSGQIHSWAERQIVLGAARGTRGIRHVIDRLYFDPYDSMRH